MKGSAARGTRANVCPRCSGTLIKDMDDDRQCLQCGYVAYARRPKQVPGKGRERRPSHKGINL
jgi:ribosomal protein S27AE